MYTIENKCPFLTGDEVEVFTCLKILSVAVTSVATPENMSFHGREGD